MLEYAAPDGSRGYAGIFRLAGSEGSNSYLFRPRGLNMTKRYHVTFDNSGGTVEMSGLDLAQRGLHIVLENTLSSELLLFEALPGVQ